MYTSKFDVERSITGVTKSVLESLQKLNRTKKDTLDRLKPEIRALEIDALKLDLAKGMAAKVKKFRIDYELFRDEVARKYRTEILAYKPDDRADETLYYLKKSDKIRHLESMTPDEILQNYQNEKDPVNLRIFEEEGARILKNQKSSKFATFNQIKTAEQKKRITEETAKNIQYIEDKQKLYNFSERMLQNLENGGGQGVDLFTWEGLSGSKERLTAGQIREAWRNGAA